MLCPRCQREVADAVTFCPGCGTPLRLRDEPSPQAVDSSIPIDRRGGERTILDATVTAPIGAPRRPRERADVDRSHWEIGKADAPDKGPSARSVTESAGRAAPEPEIGPRPSPPPRAPARPGVAGTSASVERTEDLRIGSTGDGSPRDQDVPQTAPGEVRVVRPETWRRAAAWGVDAVPVAVAAVLLARSFVRQAEPGAPVQGLDGFLDLVAREGVIVASVAAAAALALVVYATLAHALAGATLGKRLFGLRVVCADGARPTMGRSAARAALGFASMALLGLGFILALFTRSGRALHDFLARTWVVRAP